MSSPPTPTTSTRNVTLSSRQKCRHSSSFPSIAALNPFRKKLPDKPPTPVEPYEVAPGIWNTDATAKVFGYVSSDDGKRHKSKSRDHSVKSKKKGQTPPARTNPVLLVDRAEASRNEVHNDNENPDSTRPTHQQYRAAQEQRANRRRTKAHRMRTVSSDDQLTVRGANPRTGLVSPFVLTDASSSGPDSDPDYINIPHPKSGRVARTRSGKWKQDGQGWSLVESPLLSPIAQSTNGTIRGPSRQISAGKLGDKLLQHMPGVDDPEPVNMRDWEVRKFQENLADLRRREGSDAMVDPDTLPSPRVCTPEGPSTPPNRMRKIARKMVGGGGMPGGIGSVTGGSGPTPKDASTDTVVRHEQRRASSIPTPRKEVKEQHHRVRIVTPSNTPKEISLETRTDEGSKVGMESPFLGLRQPASGQTVNGTQSPSPPIMRLKEAHRRLCLLARQPEEERYQYLQTTQLEEAPHQPPRQDTQFPSPQIERQEEAHRRPFPRIGQSPSEENLADPQAILTLNQYLPRLPHFLPPSHFANLEARTHCRPEQLLPARLRPLDQQRKVVEDACTSTSISITTSRSRPKVQRQNESRDVPRANRHSPEQKVRKESYRRPIIQRDRQPSCTSHMADDQDTTPERTRHSPQSERVDRQGGLAEVRHQENPQSRHLDRQVDSVGASHSKRPQLPTEQHQRRNASLGSEHAARAAVLGDIHNQQVEKIKSRQRSGSSQTLDPESTDIVRDTAQEKVYGAGCTLIYDRPGNHIDKTYSEWGFPGSTGGEVKSRARPIGPTEFAVHGDGAAWFAGHWAEVERTGPQGAALLRRTSSLRRTAIIKLWLRAVEDSLQVSAKLCYVGRQLEMMACHVLRTFRHDSRVLVVLSSPKASTQDCLFAVKDVVLAGLYLIVLLNVLMALRKVVLLVVRVLYLFWHPLETIAMLLRWCVMT